MTIGRKPEAKTTCFTCRLDLRSLASLARFYAERKIAISSRNMLLGIIVEDFLAFLVDQKITTSIESTSEALAVLMKLYGEASINNKARGALLQQLARERMPLPTIDTEPTADISRLEQIQSLVERETEK